MTLRILLLLLWVLGMMPALAQEAVPGGDYFVEAVVDNPTPYVGQQVTYTFRLYHAVELENLFFQASDFGGFSRVTLFSSNQSSLEFTRSYAAVINGLQYRVSELDIILFPIREGNIEIAPSVLVFGETVFRDEQRLSTNPVLVQVQPLPEGAPEGFNGAVGRFEMMAVLDHASVTLGEPITLRVIVTGSGNFEQLAPPELPLPEDWRVYENPVSSSAGVTGGLFVGEKTFEWLIVPSQTGTQILPAITLTYFDPEALAYRSVSTSPVTLEIHPPEEGAAPPVFDDSLAAASSAVPPLKPIPAILQPVNLYPDAAFWLLWLIPPICATLSWWWADRRHRKQADHVKIRQSKALRRAQEHLQTARRMRSNDACRVISEAIFLYFGDKLGREAAGLTQDDVQQVMKAVQVNDILRERVITCLEWADEGRYAPVEAVNAQSLLQRALETLTAVDAVWKTQ